MPARRKFPRLRTGALYRRVASEVAIGVEAGLAPVHTRAAARLFPELEVADRHPSVDRLAHVVDVERGDRAGGERFHLHARAVDGVDLRLHHHVIVLDSEIDVHGPYEQRMAQWQQIRSLLSRLDPGDP